MGKIKQLTVPQIEKQIKERKKRVKEFLAIPDKVKKMERQNRIFKNER